jgi:hypothetical protein
MLLLRGNECGKLDFETMHDPAKLENVRLFLPNEGAGEQGAGENIWTEEGLNNRRLESTAK